MNQAAYIKGYMDKMGNPYIDEPLAVLGGLTGAGIGAVSIAALSKKNRIRNAILGALTGAGLGVGAGYAGGQAIQGILEGLPRTSMSTGDVNVNTPSVLEVTLANSKRWPSDEGGPLIIKNVTE